MRWLAILACSLLALSPVSAQEEKTKPPAPQDTFQAAADAIKKKDWRAFVGQTSKESHTVMAGMFVLLSSVLGEVGGLVDDAKFKPIKTLMAQHGVKAEKGLMEKLQDFDNKDAKKMAKMLKDMGQRIQNKPEWIVSFIKIMESIEPGGMMNQAFEEFGGKLGNVQIDGKTARATLSGVRGGVNRSETIFFVVEDGVWKLDLMKMLEARGFQ
jgi:hypothetical protein